MVKTRTANLQWMKEINRTLLLDLIRKQPGVSRADLTAITKLSPTTVSSLVELLIGEGLVREIGPGPSVSGRKPILLEVNPQGRLVVGVSLKHGGMEVGLVNLVGEVLEAQRWDVDVDSPDLVIAELDQAVRRLAMRYEISGVGLATIGLVNPENHKVRYARAGGWRVLELERISYPQGPFKVGNDSNALALAEIWYGRRREEDLLYLYLDEGIGSGIILKGEILRGAKGAAGEFAHISTGGDWPCACGGRGCLGPKADGKALVRQAKERGIHVDGLTDLLEKAEAGEPVLEELVRSAAREIGRVTISAVHLLAPPRVVLGGLLGKSPLVQAEIRETMRLSSFMVSDVSLSSACYHPWERVRAGAGLVIREIFAPRRRSKQA